MNTSISAPIASLPQLFTGTGARQLLCHARSILRRRADVCPATSLRGAPSAAEMSSAWRITPRTPVEALIIGSRLLDLEPTVDNSFVFAVDRWTGERRIVRRHSGIKGWLALHCPDITYSTAMRHKKLASRLRTVCGLPPNIPLEWILPGATEPPAARAPAIRAIIQKGRLKMAALLEAHPSLRSLTAASDEQLGLVHLPRAISSKKPLIAHSYATPSRRASRPPKHRASRAPSALRRRQNSIPFPWLAHTTATLNRMITTLTALKSPTPIERILLDELRHLHRLAHKAPPPSAS